MPANRSVDPDRVWLFDTRETPAREAYLLLQHVAGLQVQGLGVLLRPSGITPAQYHVLRVLREAGSAGLSCSAVATRSVSGDPDVTRLLDRLEKQGLVGRSRESSDRRVVTSRITDRGLQLLDELEDAVNALHAGQLESLGDRDRADLRRLLRKLASATAG